ncbi:MAG: DNA primase [Patescibacteria group bacterium]
MSQIQTIKDSTDIVEIIGAKLQLQRSGSYFRTTCPFHSEKSPSFFVSESMQRYKCFGCNQSGDVYNFLEEYEGMTFYEALQFLADKAGIKLDSYRPSKEDDERKQVLEVLDLAKEYYHYLLTKHKVGELARDYLKDRGSNNQSIKIFQIGYASNSWNGLIKYLHGKKKYSYDVLQRAGLILNKGGRYYDRFRNRVIFPLKNHRGLVVGFSGRTLDKDPKSAKYINSPETSIYHKKEMLYGFSELYQEIRKAKEVIVVEGEFDVISSSQHHVNNIVAIKGSALTPEHVKLIRRVAEKIILSLDTDSAGIEATKRAISIVQAEGLELRVLQVEGAKDVDELIQEDAKKWRDASKSSISVYEFFLQTSLKNHDVKSPEGKRKIINELASIFKQITHGVERDFYIKKLAKKLEVRESVVRDDVERFGKIPLRQGSTRQIKKSKTNSKKQIVSKKEKLEKYLLFLIANSKKDLDIELFENLKFETTELKQIFEKVLAKATKKLPEDLQQILFDISYDPKLLRSLDSLNFKKELKNTIQELKKLSIKNEIEKITKKLEDLDKSVDKSEKVEKQQQELLRQIVELRRKR